MCGFPLLESRQVHITPAIPRTAEKDIHVKAPTHQAVMDVMQGPYCHTCCGAIVSPL